MASLEREFKYYQANKERLLSEHKGKFAIIKGEKILGIFDDKANAIETTKKDHPLGTFMVQEVVEDDVLTFHSQVLVGGKQDAS